jgi:hypothetical protein
VKIKPPKNGYGESNAIAYLPPEKGAALATGNAKPASDTAGTSVPLKMASAPWNKKG